MNANELANLIGMCSDGGYNQDAATMLRQQQAEIEALKEFYVPKKNEGDFKTVSRKELLDYIEWLREANTKALTDDEIKSLIPTTDCYNYDLSQQDFVDFARAILRKAQEKC